MTWAVSARTHSPKTVTLDSGGDAVHDLSIYG